MRRYTALKATAGDRIPPELRLAVLGRDGGCVGFGRLPGDCRGALELDHVRASHAVSMKSRTEADNLVALCGAHHRWKTEHGPEGRRVLLEYLEGVS